MPTAAAFFDLDRTLMSGSSGFFWARAAANAGIISRRQLASDAAANIRFRLQGSTDASADKVMARVGELITGKRAKDFERLGPEVMAGVLPRLYPQMLEIGWRHQDEGRPVYIVTAATQETAAMVAHVIGFDGGLGTRLEVKDGLYTGQLDGQFAYREGKPLLMDELATTNDIDLKASYAYSDSESDLPMLRAVGHAVAVNPDSELARIAKEEGWEILRFDRLQGHLRMLGGLAAATLLGAAGRGVVSRVR
jgi:HAD superfamily hydrolase (TIGR01490 family)